MKIKYNIISKILIFLLLFSFLGSFYTVQATEGGDFYTNSSKNLLNPSTTPTVTAGDTTQNEQDILNSAAYDASGIHIRNLDTLNIRIDNLWQFVRWGLGILSVFGTISSFFILSKSFLQLAWIPDHPIQRRKVYTDILTSGVCTILFAGLSLIVTIFFKTFENFLNNSVMLSSDFKSAFALFLIEYKYLIAGACGVMTLTLIVFLIKDIVVLAGSGGNPQARSSAIKGIMFTILGIIGSGSVGLLIGIFTGLLAF